MNLLVGLQAFVASCVFPSPPITATTLVARAARLGFLTCVRSGDEEVARRERWSQSMDLVHEVVLVVVRGLGRVVGDCDGNDRESYCDPTPSCTTTGRTPVTPILKASLVHCVKVQFSGLGFHEKCERG